MQLWFDGFVAFSPVEVELIRALSRSCEVVVTLSESASTDEFHRLALQWGVEDRLLATPPRRPEIAAVNAPTLEREADEIARRIVELRERGVAWGEIGVGLRDTETWLPLLRGTFERFGIPARYYFASPLRHHPAAQFLGGLIRNVLEGWEFGAALDTLRAHPQWGAWAAFDSFDFAVREAMPGRGADALLALCERDTLKEKLADCFALAAWTRDRLLPAQWAARLNHLAETLYRPGRIEPPRSFSDVETLRSQAAGLRAWTEAVSLAPRFWPGAGKPIGLEEFWRVAAELVDAASVQVRDDRRDVVHVMNVYEVRQWDISALFVCGTTDRDYPRKAQQNLLFPDIEIAALGIPLRKAADLERDEAALFASLRGRARDTLVLTWSDHDAGGRRAESSRYVRQLIDEGRATTRPARLCRPEPARMPASAGVAGRVVGTGMLRQESISLTGLEDMLQCRFKFFAGRTLGLRKRPERPHERLVPREVGLILHEALEGWLMAGRQGEFVPFFEVAFDKACREKHFPEGYRLEVERIESRRVAERVSTTERWTSEYPPEVEVPVTLAFPGGVTINGRVDRVDRLNERECVIVDYKSGKVHNVARFTESSVKLQGPLYALGVRENRGLETVAMMFHAVREDKRFGWGEVPGADLGLKPIPERWIADAKERAIERLESFLAGNVHPQPTEREHCRWCDYSAACRVEEEREALVQVGGSGG
jgi:ATP-dependent helicase/DNAse subunit B